ncbi:MULTISPECIES: TetR/AcrR family transcriptional regulator [unclassified Pseudomonas]|uniref:TetR/AcrR family transcriptional regulator n=1 Tax=unclassified Pseudomonas TaxID=196821 RepID=UPI002E80FC1B|nr:TetR/AcrR family transcriptional regulator [Pseudomonas sp. 10C3]MEE3505830.1 TetR/AcrR family transcriptional regulator [Pseudomonas sp. 10C3]
MSIPERCSRFAQSRDKALDLFARKGFGQVGMRELATYLGLTPGSLYHHYPSKQHLLLDLIEELYEELLTTVRLIEQSPDDGVNTLQVIIRAHLNLYREMPLHFRLAERDSCCLNEEQQLRVSHLREQYERQLLVALGYRTLFTPHRLQAAGHAIASLLSSAPSWLVQRTLDDQDRDELMEDLMMGAICSVLRSPASSNARAVSMRKFCK